MKKSSQSSLRELRDEEYYRNLYTINISLEKAFLQWYVAIRQRTM